MLRLAVGGALLAAVALSGSAGARTPRAAAVTETTVITAAQSGWLDVALYDDATLTFKGSNNPDVSVAGQGRLLALTMRSLGTTWENSDELTVYRLPSFLGSKELVNGTTDSTGGCTEGGTAVGPITAPTGGGECHYTTPKHFVLHEGLYRISVLADGAPVTFTLTFHGLDEGTTSLAPTHTLVSTQKSLPKLDSVDNKMVTFGATAHLPKAEPAYVVTAAKGSVKPTFYEESICVRQDGPSPVPPFAYGPHCPGGVSGSYWYEFRVPNSDYWGGGMGVFFGGSLLGAEGDDYGIGGAFSDSGGITLTNALGVWMQPTP
jgi:hypothetical protein